MNRSKRLALTKETELQFPLKMNLGKYHEVNTGTASLNAEAKQQFSFGHVGNSVPQSFTRVPSGPYCLRMFQINLDSPHRINSFIALYFMYMKRELVVVIDCICDASIAVLLRLLHENTKVKEYLCDYFQRKSNIIYMYV